MRALVVAAILLTLALLTRQASAHAVGLSTGEYTAHGAFLTARTAFAKNELALLVPGLDHDSDGHITAAEVADAHELLTAKILGRIHVTQMGAVCNPTLEDAGLTEQDGILISARWACPKGDQPFQIDLAILDDLQRGHRHVARTVSGPNVHDDVLFGDQRTLTIALAHANALGGQLRAAVRNAEFAGSRGVHMEILDRLGGLRLLRGLWFRAAGGQKNGGDRQRDLHHIF